MRTVAWYVVVAAGLPLFTVIVPVFAQREAVEEVQLPAVGQEMPSPTLPSTLTPTPQPSPTPSPGPTLIPAPRCTTSTAWPPDFAIAAPAEGLDPVLARFSGVWEGTWSGFSGPYPGRLGIEQIESGRAVGVYAYPAVGDLTGGWIRFSPPVFGDTIIWGPAPAGIKFSFTISRDGQTISGLLEQPPLEAAVITMSRCTLG
jgi:hypothetical protein